MNEVIEFQSAKKSPLANTYINYVGEKELKSIMDRFNRLKSRL